MNLIYERYSFGIFSNNIVNYISNDKFFKRKTIKIEHLTQQKSYGVHPNYGDNT